MSNMSPLPASSKDVRLLFPKDALNSRSVDSHFAPEAQAAAEAGFATCLIDHDALCGAGYDGDLAVRGIARVVDEPVSMLYRGWMINVREAYAALENALDCKGYSLITGAQYYFKHHYLPGWYDEIAELTPRSFWYEKTEQPFDVAAIAEQLAAKWGEGGAVVKDYVKSRKDEWLDACYMPRCADTANVTRVLSNFIERQGSFLSGGVVLRQFERWSKEEYRLWFCKGELFYITNKDGQVDSLSGDFQSLQSHPIIRNGPLISVDVVQNTNYDWRVIEIGDGQVSGLPSGCDYASFYSALHKVLSIDS